MDSLLLARHAESAYSAPGTLNGDPSIAVSLTEEGRAQARRLGEAIADEPIDLCTVTEFVRTRETAELALEGRGVPLVVVPELNDHPAGRWEGRPLTEYLEWAHAAPPDEVIPGGTVSRAAYLLGAAAGRDPATRMGMLPYAEAAELAADEVGTGVTRLEGWYAALHPKG